MSVILVNLNMDEDGMNVLLSSKYLLSFNVLLFVFHCLIVAYGF